MIGTQVTELAGGPTEWRWGVRVTPFLNLLALVLLVVFMVDPPRGKVIAVNIFIYTVNNAQ